MQIYIGRPSTSCGAGADSNAKASSAASGEESGQTQRRPSASNVGMALHEAFGLARCEASRSGGDWGMAVHAPCEGNANDFTNTP